MGDYYQNLPSGEPFVITGPNQLVDKEAKIVCPYDPNHEIPAKRFHYHLLKCRKNNPGKDLKPSPDDARYMVPGSELCHLMKTFQETDHCNMNRKYNPDDQGNISVPKYRKDLEVPKTSESWDDEIEHDHVQYSYPPACDPSRTLSYQQRACQMGARSNGHERMKEEPPSLIQPQSQSTSTVAPQPQQSYPQASAGTPLNLQPPASDQETGSPAAQTPTWSQIAGIGRGIPNRAGDFPVVGQSSLSGIGRGIVRTPPGFGRRQPGRKAGPPLAADIYNNIQQRL